MAKAKKQIELPASELKELLKEARDLLVLCTLIDRSGQCNETIEKIDKKMGWK